MPGEVFTQGDACELRLEVDNPGSHRLVDLYVLLEVYGRYYAFPSWSEIGSAIDHLEFLVSAGEVNLELIPAFTMPQVTDAGPFYFYGAMFEPGTLELGTLVSNGTVWAFSLADGS